MYEQYPILTPEQEALIPVYREKWRKVALSTEAIDRQKAAAAVTAVYTLMGKNAPKIEFCESPYAALVAISNREETELPSDGEATETQAERETVWQQIQLSTIGFLKLLRFLFRLLIQQRAKKHPLKELTENLNHAAFKFDIRRSEDLLPKDLSSRELLRLLIHNLDNLDKMASEEKRRTKSLNLQDSQISEASENESKHNELAAWSAQLDECYNSIAWIPGKRRLIRYFCKASYFARVGLLCQEEDLHKAYRKISQNLKKEMAYIYGKYSPLFCPQWEVMQAIFFDFLRSELNSTLDDRFWQAYQDLVQECGWIFAFDKTCYICDRPRILHLDDDSELAIEFADGFRL